MTKFMIIEGLPLNTTSHVRLFAIELQEDMTADEMLEAVEEVNNSIYEMAGKAGKLKFSIQNGSVTEACVICIDHFAHIRAYFEDRT